MSRVWLITGSASGLGRNIAKAVLASGMTMKEGGVMPFHLNGRGL